MYIRELTPIFSVSNFSRASPTVSIAYKFSPPPDQLSHLISNICCTTSKLMLFSLLSIVSGANHSQCPMSSAIGGCGHDHCQRSGSNAKTFPCFVPSPSPKCYPTNRASWECLCGLMGMGREWDRVVWVVWGVWNEPAHHQLTSIYIIIYCYRGYVIMWLCNYLSLLYTKYTTLLGR
jgi:hypothetical protein